jgi:hypothetical protein
MMYPIWAICGWRIVVTTGLASKSRNLHAQGSGGTASLVVYKAAQLSLPLSPISLQVTVIYVMHWFNDESDEAQAYYQVCLSTFFAIVHTELPLRSTIISMDIMLSSLTSSSPLPLHMKL